MSSRNRYGQLDASPQYSAHRSGRARCRDGEYSLESAALAGSEANPRIQLPNVKLMFCH